jgi:hypothetical protein
MLAPSSAIVHVGLDECGSLTADTPLFAMAAVLTSHPEQIQNLIKRAVLHSGKRLRRSRKASSELKWRNASQRIRAQVLTRLAQADVEIFTLTVHKTGRRVADTPEHYAILVCELLRLCWEIYPNMVLSLDRHFTSPIQMATVNTIVHRQWPATGVLSIAHVDSQRSPLVQLADFAAGSVYSQCKTGDATFRLIENRVGAALVEDWRHIKARWK